MQKFKYLLLLTIIIIKVYFLVTLNDVSNIL
jgi:hypothetical protein